MRVPVKNQRTIKAVELLPWPNNERKREPSFNICRRERKEKAEADENDKQNG